MEDKRTNQNSDDDGNDDIDNTADANIWLIG